MRGGDRRIYVQIPAYRDLELLPTVADLLRTAARPECLVVGIAWQYGPDESGLDKALRRLGPVNLLAIPAAESRGCNWARAQLQQRWSGEEYTLFLDSHHRFAPGWDDTLVDMQRRLRERGVDRPVLTGYLPPYDPVHDPAGRVQAIYRMDLADRRDGLMFRLTGHAIRDWSRLTRPVPTGFVSLHLLFAEGAFNEVVRMDPEIYFFADEIAVGLRAFTHGYDLFHPHVVLGWHLYDRRTRTTHWADHADGHRRSARSLDRLRALYGGADLGPLGVGGRRTRRAYERQVGRRLLERAPLDDMHTLMEEAR
jgi:hypothetical protein